MSAARLRSLCTKLALTLVATVACLLALEIATRLLGNVEPSLAVRHPVLGKIHRPGFEGSVYVEEAGRPVFVRFNRDGFRGSDVPYDPEPGVRRIAVIGDSMVAAVEVDEGDTGVAVLERRLAASDPERRPEVLNFGAAGSSTGQELVLYEQLVRRYHPDLVILVYFMGNDFSDNSRRLSNNPRIYFELDEDGALVQLPYSATSKKLSAWLNENSRFYVWQKAAFKKLRHELGARSGYRIFDRDPNATLEDAWRLNAALLEAFRDAVEADGARFVLVLCPAGAQIYDDMWSRVLHRAGADGRGYGSDYPRARLGAIADSAGISMLDLTPGLRAARGADRAAALSADERLYLAGGEGHLTRKGNREVAHAIERFLKEGEAR